MFIIEFVVKIIINESDISISKKREYMLLMLRSLLSMFNLFEGGVIHSEKKNFEKLMDMISQLLLLLKTQFTAEMDSFLSYWQEKGLLKEIGEHFELSNITQEILQKMGEEEGAIDPEERARFCESIRDLIRNAETNTPNPLRTRVVCETDSGLLKMDRGRRSIINMPESLIDQEQSDLKEILRKQFISQEVFHNETKVVMNLVVGNRNSTILVDNFQKLFFMLLKMEEFTLQGVLMNFRMRNVIKPQQKQPRVSHKRTKRNRITRFTSLMIPKGLEADLLQYSNKKQRKPSLQQSNFIPRNTQPTQEQVENQFNTNPSPRMNLESEIQLDQVPRMPRNLVFTKQDIPESGGLYQDFGFQGERLPNWLAGCLTIASCSQTDPLVFYSLEFLYTMLDWEEVLTHSLAVRYNNFLYKEKMHFQEKGVFTKLLKRIFDLMEVNAYKKIAINYFLSFVLENCEFVVKFVKKKLRSETARDFRQIASLWKHTSHIKSSKVRLCLQETVFDMLNYSDKEDPLIRNYFRNWLQFSENNFILIVDNLLKKLYQHTNMQLQNGQIVYNFLYNTRTFDRLLKLLKSVFVYGGNLFIQFIRKFSISSEFETFNIEIDTILGSLFQNYSKKYYVFILKMLLMYLLADPNKDLYQVRTNVTFESVPIPKFYIVKITFIVTDNHSSFFLFLSLFKIPFISTLLL